MLGYTTAIPELTFNEEATVFSILEIHCAGYQMKKGINLTRWKSDYGITRYREAMDLLAALFLIYKSIFYPVGSIVGLGVCDAIV